MHANLIQRVTQFVEHFRQRNVSLLMQFRLDQKNFSPHISRCSHFTAQTSCCNWRWYCVRSAIIPNLVLKINVLTFSCTENYFLSSYQFNISRLWSFYFLIFRRRVTFSLNLPVTTWSQKCEHNEGIIWDHCTCYNLYLLCWMGYFLGVNSMERYLTVELIAVSLNEFSFITRI